MVLTDLDRLALQGYLNNAEKRLTTCDFEIVRYILKNLSITAVKKYFTINGSLSLLGSILSISNDFCPELARKCREHLNYYILLKNRAVPDDFFEELLLNYDCDCRVNLKYDTAVPEKIIDALLERCPDKLSIDYLCTLTTLSTDFFDKLISRYPDQVSWYNLCENISLDEDFFRKYLSGPQAERLRSQLDNLTHNPNISPSFLKEIFSSNLYYQLLPMMHNLTLDDVQDYYDYLARESLVDVEQRAFLQVIGNPGHYGNFTKLYLQLLGYDINNGIAPRFFSHPTIVTIIRNICIIWVNRNISQKLIEEGVIFDTGPLIPGYILQTNPNISAEFFIKHPEHLENINIDGIVFRNAKLFDFWMTRKNFTEAEKTKYRLLFLAKNLKDHYAKRFTRSLEILSGLPGIGVVMSLLKK